VIIIIKSERKIIKAMFRILRTELINPYPRENFEAWIQMIENKIISCPAEHCNWDTRELAVYSKKASAYGVWNDLVGIWCTGFEITMTELTKWNTMLQKWLKVIVKWVYGD